MTQIREGGLASWRLEQPHRPPRRGRRSATAALPNETAAGSQSQAKPQIGATVPTPAIRHPGPRAPVDSPCLAHSLSVPCLCKPCNPGPNARHPARPAPPPTSAAPPSARAALPTVLAAHFSTASPGSVEGIGVGPVEPPSPSPASMACCRRRAPRPRQIAERQPRTPIRRWPPFASPRHAPNPAKTHPASPQEFFGKNSYCARGVRSTPRQHPQRPRTLSRPLRRSHAPCPGDLPAHPRHAYGPTRPAAGPSLGAVVPGVRSSESRSKKSAQTVSRQPVPFGDGLARDGSPLHPHASAAHARPAGPCTLLPRSTVTPESRS